MRFIVLSFIQPILIHELQLLQTHLTKLIVFEYKKNLML
jgi:hypothetical protein